VNVEVLQSSSGRLPLKVKFGERMELGKGFVIDFGTRLTNTPQQSLSRPTEGAILPTGVLLSGIALPLLEDPLEGIIDDPPPLAELRYEAI
jgi:hypothetical protein